MKTRALVLLAAAIACGESSSPSDRAHLDVTFQRTPLANVVVPDSAAITTVGGTIDIDGKFLAGDPCRLIRGSLVVAGDHIQVTMRADTDGSSGCSAVVARFGYAATVTGVGHGTWTVDVRHLALGSGEVTLVASQMVVMQ